MYLRSITIGVLFLPALLIATKAGATHTKMSTPNGQPLDVRVVERNSIYETTQRQMEQSMENTLVVATRGNEQSWSSTLTSTSLGASSRLKEKLRSWLKTGDSVSTAVTPLPETTKCPSSSTSVYTPVSQPPEPSATTSSISQASLPWPPAWTTSSSYSTVSKNNIQSLTTISSLRPESVGGSTSTPISLVTLSSAPIPKVSASSTLIRSHIDSEISTKVTGQLCTLTSTLGGSVDSRDSIINCSISVVVIITATSIRDSTTSKRWTSSYVTIRTRSDNLEMTSRFTRTSQGGSMHESSSFNSYYSAQTAPPSADFVSTSSRDIAPGTSLTMSGNTHYLTRNLIPLSSTQTDTLFPQRSTPQRPVERPPTIQTSHGLSKSALSSPPVSDKKSETRAASTYTWTKTHRPVIITSTTQDSSSQTISSSDMTQVPHIDTLIHSEISGLPNSNIQLIFSTKSISPTSLTYPTTVTQTTDLTKSPDTSLQTSIPLRSILPSLLSATTHSMNLNAGYLQSSPTFQPSSTTDTQASNTASIDSNQPSSAHSSHVVINTYSLTPNSQSHTNDTQTSTVPSREDSHVSSGWTSSIVFPARTNTSSIIVISNTQEEFRACNSTLYPDSTTTSLGLDNVIGLDRTTISGTGGLYKIGTQTFVKVSNDTIVTKDISSTSLDESTLIVEKMSEPTSDLKTVNQVLTSGGRKTVGGDILSLAPGGTGIVVVGTVTIGAGTPARTNAATVYSRFGKMLTCLLTMLHGISLFY